MAGIVIPFFLTSLISNAQTEDYSYSLTQSNNDYSLWTSTPSTRIFKVQDAPAGTGSDIKVYCARNETEPFLIVVRPAATGTVQINLGSFGTGISADIHQVKYTNITTASDNMGTTGDYPDPLWPLENGAVVSVTADENTAFWINIYVSSTVAAGDYTADLNLQGIIVPVKLHVFNFTVPPELHVKSEMGVSYQTILTRYSVPGYAIEYWNYVDNIKLFLIRHRLTPKNPLFPGGLTSGGGECWIDYDCNGTLSDPYGIWGFESPANKYLNGNEFNYGTGFPSFSAISFNNNDASADQRPSTFCGQVRTASDWYTGDNPSSVYNQKWFTYITSISNYLSSKNLLDKAYYWIANEPQDQDDYDAVSWYSRELKKAAPDLKILLSEEPRPEIYNNQAYPGSKIDIWLSELGNYNPDISWEREINNGEDTWLYFLSKPPYFNPIILDHPGIEGKLSGWFFWKYRIKGISHFSLTDWNQNPWANPFNYFNGLTFLLYPPAEDNSNIVYGSNNHRFVTSVRLELMRDGLEDFEYLYLLNGGNMPEADVTNISDTQADKVISGLTSYNRDDEYLYNLRRLIGLKLGGEIATIPDINPTPVNARSQGDPGNYYINFQNPVSDPVADPLVINGNTYMKIGWTQYNETDGYGWFGDLSEARYQYLSTGPNELQKSIIYDDYGRLKTFEFDLPNGSYTVTVSVGYNGHGYPHQKIRIEGVDFISDEATNVSDPYLVRTKNVTVSDYKLSMEMGVRDEYTMLNYLNIESIATNSEKNPVNDAVKIYPNPLTDISSVSFESGYNNLVEFTDLTGRVILRTRLMNGRAEIYRQNFNSGIYLVRVYEDDFTHCYVVKLLVGN